MTKANAVVLLFQSYGGKVPDALTISSYREILSGFTDDRVEYAVRYLIRAHGGEFPPSAGDVAAECERQMADVDRRERQARQAPLLPEPVAMDKAEAIRRLVGRCYGSTPATFLMAEERVGGRPRLVPILERLLVPALERDQGALEMWRSAMEGLGGKAGMPSAEAAMAGGTSAEGMEW